MNDAAVIIGFRDRGTDPHRTENLYCVLGWWNKFTSRVIVVGDGRMGDAQFNRSAAYNRGTAQTDADMLVYAEADMLIDQQQLRQAITIARQHQGLVVPFTFRKNLSETDTELVRGGLKNLAACTPTNGPCGETGNYGCLNIVSRATLDAIQQWDELFEGNAHDDAAMWHAFNIAAGPMQLVDGAAYHLYHRESVGVHTCPQDKAATEANYRRMQLYFHAKTPEEIRHLTAGGKTLHRNWRGKLC